MSSLKNWWLKKVLAEDEEKAIRREQEKINKAIEKQLKKERREYKSMHKLQIVGLEGSGKSTVIKQVNRDDKIKAMVLIAQSGFYTPKANTQ